MDVRILNDPNLLQDKIHFDAQVLSTNCVCKFECTSQQHTRMQSGNVYAINVFGFNTNNKRVSCSLETTNTTSDVFFFSDHKMKREQMDDDM